MVMAVSTHAAVDHTRDGEEWHELGLEPSQSRHYAHMDAAYHPSEEHGHAYDDESHHYARAWDVEVPIPIHHEQVDHGYHGDRGVHHQDYYRGYQHHKTDPYSRIAPHHDSESDLYKHYDSHSDWRDERHWRNGEEDNTGYHESYLYHPYEAVGHQQHYERAHHDSEYAHRYDQLPSGHHAPSSTYGQYAHDSDYELFFNQRAQVLEDDPNFMPWLKERLDRQRAAKKQAQEEQEQQQKKTATPTAPATPKPTTSKPAPAKQVPTGKSSQPAKATEEPAAAKPQPKPTPTPTPKPTPAPVEPTEPETERPSPKKTKPVEPQPVEPQPEEPQPEEPQPEEPTEEDPEAAEPTSSDWRSKAKAKGAAFQQKSKTFIDEEIADGDVEKFVQYCAEFGKSYVNQQEFKLRLLNWKRSEKFIQDQSWDGRRHYKIAHNKFSDWSKPEYEKMLGYAAPAEKQAKDIAKTTNSATIADSIDWRESGLVTKVNNQSFCGSDWAFAAAGAMEGAFAVKTGKLVELSAQQLLDCTGAATSCKGGTMSQAFDYLKQSGAVKSADYPYNENFPRRGECQYDESKSTGALVDQYTFAESGDVDMMKQALSHQPIAAAINASALNVRLYESGVFDDEFCEDQEMNHGVTLVGYGNEGGTGYWIAKNSWGSDWGEDGFMRIAIKPGKGICGVQTTASWVVLQ